jgi:imidazoleglycerol phosphate synthase glutamine amidotransferase subunit HisH
MITGKLYDWLKYLAQIVLPAVGTLYFTLSGIWSLGSADKVVGTIMAIDLFLGVLLGISQANYNKAIEDAGELQVHDGQMNFVLDADKTDIDALGDKKEVRFKVKKKRGGDSK